MSGAAAPGAGAESAAAAAGGAAVLVREDWSRFNRRVLAEAGMPIPRAAPVRRSIGPGSTAAAAALVAAVLTYAVAAGDRPAEPAPPAEPPVLRIHPDDLARLRAPPPAVPPPAMPPLRIDAGDLGRLKVAVDVPPLRIDPADLARLKPAPAFPPQAAAAAATPAAAAPNAPRVVTNFSVFKSVAFRGGAVVTEWAYDSSEGTAPSRQHCYFDVSAAGGGARVQGLQNTSVGRLAFDPQNPPGLGHADWQEALTLCRWFGGAAPR